MIIEVEKIDKIEPHLVMRAPSNLDIHVTLSEGLTERLFYKIWAEIEDEKLREWLNREGYDLVKLNK